MTKTFEELRNPTRVSPEQPDDEVMLEEGLFRKGASTSYAVKSKAAGDRATQRFSSAAKAVTSQKAEPSVHEQLAQIRIALAEIAAGMVEMRNLAGNIAALSYISNDAVDGVAAEVKKLSNKR